MMPAIRTEHAKTQFRRLYVWRKNNQQKANQTGAVNFHKMIVMPARSLGEADKNDASSFEVPSDSRGITYIIRQQLCDLIKLCVIE